MMKTLRNVFRAFALLGMVFIGRGITLNEPLVAITGIALIAPWVIGGLAVKAGEQ